MPIQKLAEGTHEVAHGNWDYKIEASGDDEIGVLVDSFNQMTGDLKQINPGARTARQGGRNAYSPISPPAWFRWIPAGKITTWNKAAEQMLGVNAEQALAKNYREVFRAEPLRVIARDRRQRQGSGKHRAGNQDLASASSY